MTTRIASNNATGIPPGPEFWAAAPPANHAPTGDLMVYGRVREGRPLIADATALADEDGLGAFTYAWLRDGAPIEGETGLIYRLTSADIGAAISARVSYTDGLGTKETITSDPTAIMTARSASVIANAEAPKGGPGDDWLRGGPSDDQLEGRGGADRLIGGVGDDRLHGGDGADRLHGGDGGDRLHGGAGGDILAGEGGGDFLSGDRGRDRLHGGDGDDILLGGRGDDMLDGGRGADMLKGGDGADRLIGASGGDTLKGGRGDDMLLGGDGADILKGDHGDDRLKGGDGDDILLGGRGDDILKGGDGADMFRFRALDGDDVIRDFQNGRDSIEIVTGATGFGGLEISDTARGALIAFGQATVLLKGVDANQIDAGDFIF
ncbi:MAG: hypothetical protein ACK5MQ_07285 [Pikeienuella sp.]